MCFGVGACSITSNNHENRTSIHGGNDTRAHERTKTHPIFFENTYLRFSEEFHSRFDAGKTLQGGSCGRKERKETGEGRISHAAYVHAIFTLFCRKVRISSQFMLRLYGVNS